MKFALNADSMAPVQQGIGSIFKALAQAPVVRQQMQEQAALRNAQTYNANMSGNKHGAEAAGLQYTLDQRKGIEDLIAKNPQFAQNVQSAMRVWAATGKGDPSNIANAATEFQTQGIRDQAVANVGDVDLMNRYNTLAKPGATYTPFEHIGNTGTVFNQATGAGSVASPALAKLFGDESRSKTTENYASAERNKTANAQTPSGKPLTAAQLRTNAEIEAAREAVAQMNEADVQALLNKGFGLTPGEESTLALMKKAGQAKYGENTIPQVKPQAAPPPASAPERSIVPEFIRNWFADTPAKNAGPTESAPKIDARAAALEKARAAISRGAPRDAVIKRLRDNGIDPTGL